MLRPCGRAARGFGTVAVALAIASAAEAQYFGRNKFVNDSSQSR